MPGSLKNPPVVFLGAPIKHYISDFLSSAPTIFKTLFTEQDNEFIWVIPKKFGKIDGNSKFSILFELTIYNAKKPLTTTLKSTKNYFKNLKIITGCFRQSSGGPIFNLGDKFLSLDSNWFTDRHSITMTWETTPIYSKRLRTASESSQNPLDWLLYCPSDDFMSLCTMNFGKPSRKPRSAYWESLPLPDSLSRAPLPDRTSLPHHLLWHDSDGLKLPTPLSFPHCLLQLLYKTEAFGSSLKTAPNRLHRPIKPGGPSAPSTIPQNMEVVTTLGGRDDKHDV